MLRLLLGPNFVSFHQLAFPNWKLTNYPVQLPPLPANYLPFTAPTADELGATVTDHKPPDGARVSSPLPQSADANVVVVVTVDGLALWRRVMEMLAGPLERGHPSALPSRASCSQTNDGDA